MSNNNQTSNFLEVFVTKRKVTTNDKEITVYWVTRNEFNEAGDMVAVDIAGPFKDDRDISSWIINNNQKADTNKYVIVEN